jgi:hypothetical protein
MGFSKLVMNSRRGRIINELKDMIIYNNAHIINNENTIINNQDKIMIIYNHYIP